MLDEINERAAEEALRLKESTHAEVTVVSMGPDPALDAIRKVLAMGADRAIHICDDRLQGADLVTPAKVLAVLQPTLQLSGQGVTQRDRQARVGPGELVVSTTPDLPSPTTSISPTPASS